MAQNKLQDQFVSLTSRLESLRVKFIDSHTSPLENPDQYDLDVQAYCILSHAAFEEFFEAICIYLLSEIDNRFNLPTREVSIGTVCILHFDCSSLPLDDKWDSDQLLNDYLHNKIRERKTHLSKYSMEDNHGADIQYLKKLLIPIGIDIPHNVTLVNSLARLKDFRGNYAHSFSRVKKTMNPDDAKTIVKDVLQLAENLKDQAINMKFYASK